VIVRQTVIELKYNLYKYFRHYDKLQIDLYRASWNYVIQLGYLHFNYLTVLRSSPIYVHCGANIDRPSPLLSTGLILLYRTISRATS